VNSVTARSRVGAIGSGRGAAAGMSTPTSLTITPSGSFSRSTVSPNSRLGPSTGMRAVMARVSQSPMLSGGTASAISATWPWPMRPGGAILPDQEGDDRAGRAKRIAIEQVQLFGILIAAGALDQPQAQKAQYRNRHWPAPGG
jgi:hypothetical protein